MKTYRDKLVDFQNWWFILEFKDDSNPFRFYEQINFQFFYIKQKTFGSLENFPDTGKQTHHFLNKIIKYIIKGLRKGLSEDYFTTKRECLRKEVWGDGEEKKFFSYLSSLKSLTFSIKVKWWH